MNDVGYRGHVNTH